MVWREFWLGCIVLLLVALADLFWVSFKLCLVVLVIVIWCCWGVRLFVVVNSVVVII